MIHYAIKASANNASSRVRINSLSTDEYARRNISIGSSDQSGSEEIQIAPGNASTPTTPNSVNGTLRISKMIGRTKLSVEFDTVAQDADATTEIPSVVKGAATVTTSDNLESLSFFFASGNVVMGSYCEIYASSSRI